MAVFRLRQMEEETAAYALAVDIAEHFSPRVEALSSPFNVYADAHRLAVVLLLDSSGTGTLFGSAESYARKLYQELRSAASQPASEPRRTLKLLSCWRGAVRR